jgi:hypothetical protein
VFEAVGGGAGGWAVAEELVPDVLRAWDFLRCAKGPLGLASLLAGDALLRGADARSGGAGAVPPGLPDPLLGWLLIGLGTLIAVSQPNVLELARYPQGLQETGEPAPRAGFDLHRLAASPAFASVCLGLLAAACIARLPKPGVFLYFTF